MVGCEGALVFAMQKLDVGRRLGKENESSFLSSPTTSEPYGFSSFSLSFRNQIKTLRVFLRFLVDQEVSILHNKSLEDRLRSVIQEVNEEIDYWYFLLELRYHQHLDRLNE